MITVHVRDQWSSPTLRQTYQLVLIQLYLIRVKGRESLHVYYIAYKLANYMYKPSQITIPRATNYDTYSTL